MKHSMLRSLIIVISLTLALSSLGASGTQRPVSPPAKKAQAQGTDPKCPPNVIDASTALTWLKQGNKRWFNPPPPMKTQNWKEQRALTAKCQRPFAVVIACMDSRVPPELIFDQGLGDIFVIRVAGPVLNDDELASLEYALGPGVEAKLVVVLGHTVCGAVKGAVDRAGGTYLPGLLYKIEPAIEFVSDTYNYGRRITSDDTKNMSRVSLKNAKIVHTGILSKPALQHPGVKVTWGLYYVDSGEVAFEPADVKP
jgi:carbonic anhydrase